MPPDDPNAPPGSLREDIQFGDLVVAQGLCTRERVDECLDLLKRLASQGIQPLPRLGGLLMQRGYLGQPEEKRTVRVEEKSSDAPLVTKIMAPPPGETEMPPEARVAMAEPRNLIGKYVRVRLLGAGGMGEVWKAWDRELRRWVALKFLQHENPQELARFRLEAQAAAGLNHPGICAVYEVGKHEGRPFIAMQYLEGQTLLTYPRGDRKDLVRIVRAVAMAVQCAHEAGVIHRDLKPANVMVGPRGDVFVMDFGLAKSTSVDSSVSVSGSVVGTPAYMSPEQARGDKDLDGRADVYSLGALMYELMCGEPPFTGSGIYELIVRIANEEPKPLLKRIPDFDPDLQTIILKCLEKDRGRRYVSAQDLAEDMRRWLDHEPILAHPASVFYRLRKRLAKRRAVLILGILVGGASLILLTVTWRWKTESKAAEEAGRVYDAAVHRSREDQRRLAEATPYLEKGIRLIQQIESRMGDPDFSPGQALVQEAMEQLEKALAICPSLPQAYLALGNLCVMTGEPKRAIEEISKAVEILPRLVTARLDRIRLLLHEYEELRRLPSGENRKETDASRALLDRIEADLKAVRGTSDSGVDLLYAEALLASGQGRYEETQRLLRDYLNGAPAATLIALGQAHYWRGHALLRLGRAKEAEEDLTQALKTNARDLAALKDRASARMKQQDLKGAVADLDAVLRLQPSSIFALIQRGHARRALGDPEGAVLDYEKSLSFQLTWEAYYGRGRVRFDRQDSRSALHDFSLAAMLDGSKAEVLCYLGAAKTERGDPKGGIDLLNRAIALDPRFPDAPYYRARAFQQEGNLAGAEADYRKAVELASPSWPLRQEAERRLSEVKGHP